MSLAAISKPKGYFQTCQSRAIPYEINDEGFDDSVCLSKDESFASEKSRALDKLGLNKGEKITCALFDEVRTQCPNIVMLSGLGFESTIIHQSVLTDNSDLLKHIIEIYGKAMLELGTCLTGETPLFFITGCEEYSTIQTLIELGANVNAISSYAYERIDFIQLTVLENYVFQLFMSVEQRMHNNQDVINERDVIKTTETCALKLLLSWGACIQNHSCIVGWMRDYLVEQWHDVQSETEQLVHLVITSLNNLPTVLYPLIINYVIPPSETLNTFIRQIKDS